MILSVLKTIGAIGTIVTGLVSLVRPNAVTGFVGLQPDGPRGLSEIRGVLGGLFIGSGAAALLLNQPGAPAVLGFAYLGTAAGRLISMVIDNAFDRSNWISLVWEVFFGVVFIL
jgi:hypothetical protein